MVSPKPKILVTGASGFVGKQIVNCLLSKDEKQTVAITVRKNCSHWKERVLSYLTGDLDPNYDWSSELNNITTLVHCAARVHMMAEKSCNPLEDFRRVNVDSTLNLARQAAEAGVKRFIFLSSIKVNGETTNLRKPFTEDDIPAPVDAYGISKLEAERGLNSIACETQMEVVIIRPPLVYGPGVKANFSNLIKLVKTGVPLPLGAIKNKRSFVALENLVDLVITCIHHPNAANEIFLVSDGEDISTTELLKRISKSIGQSNRLIPIPSNWLQNAAILFGKKDIAIRLLSSLQVDNEKSRILLEWEPPLSLDEGLNKVIESL